MSDERDTDAATLPAEGLEKREFSKPVPPPFRVRLAPGVHESVWNHGRETVEVELCGVLLGRLLRDAQGPHLLVEDWIRGEHARSEGTQVTFTHATWDHIHAEMRRRHPGGGPEIVGWYHTHPGFGIFLSEMDLFIHTNFFSGPGQVALVIDPKSGEEGVFAWVKGKVDRLPGFWVGDRRIAREREPAAEGWSAPAGAAPGGGAAPRPGGDELDVAGALGRIRFGTVMALLWGLLGGWVLAGFSASWQLGGAVRDAARAEVAGLVRAGVLAGVQREETAELADRLERIAAALPADPPAAEGVVGPRAALEAAAADARALALQAKERGAVVEKALSSPRTFLTTGELAREVDANTRQMRRISDFTELLVLSGRWEAIHRNLLSGALKEEEALVIREDLVRRVEAMIRRDPGLADAVPALFPGVVIRAGGDGKDGKEGGAGGGEAPRKPPPAEEGK